jgi:hypothetical protein
VVYASDAYTTEAGAFDLLPSDQAPIDVGSWIAFNEQALTVPPETRLDVPFALAVPADATPGDHVGGIVAAVTEETTDAGGNEILVERRVGARVHLRVSGELDPSLAPDMGHVTYHYEWNPAEPGAVTFDYAVENTGNVRLQGELIARIGGPWDLLEREVVLAELPQILPGDRYGGTAEVDGVWPLGYLNAELVVRPEAVNEADAAAPIPSRSEVAGLWVPPWPQAAVAAALALIAWILVKIRKHQRRKATVTAAPTPTSPTDEATKTEPDEATEPAVGDEPAAATEPESDADHEHPDGTEAGDPPAAAKERADA